MSDIQYKVGEESFTKSRMIELAARSGVTFEEFVTNTGAAIAPGKTTDFTNTNPNVGSESTGLDGVNGSSESQDPLSQFYVTAEDLRAAGDEEDATTSLNKRFAPIGISSSEGTSFGSTNAINLQSGADSDSSTGVAILDVGKDLIGNPLKIFSSIALTS